MLDNVVTGVNKNVDKMITLGQDKIDNLAPNPEKNTKKNLEENLEEQSGGSDLNQIYKEKMIIGGRINKSLVEFLYKGNRKTKRRNNYIRNTAS